MKPTKLQLKREALNLSQIDLANLSAFLTDAGDSGHMLATIKTIEEGVLHSPRPRKTYEWKALAKVLRCTDEEISEESE